MLVNNIDVTVHPISAALPNIRHREHQPLSLHSPEVESHEIDENIRRLGCSGRQPSLLGVTGVSAQTQTTAVATSGVAKGVTLPNSECMHSPATTRCTSSSPAPLNYVRGGRVDVSDGGNLIGIDFRPADGQLNGLTDRGGLYTIDLSSRYFGASTKVSQVNPRLSGGFGALVDFNPVLNALRITGSNDQNIAVVNGANGCEPEHHRGPDQVHLRAGRCELRQGPGDRRRRV